MQSSRASPKKGHASSALQFINRRNLNFKPAADDPSRLINFRIRANGRKHVQHSRLFGNVWIWFVCYRKWKMTLYWNTCSAWWFWRSFHVASIMYNSLGERKQDDHLEHAKKLVKLMMLIWNYGWSRYITKYLNEMGGWGVAIRGSYHSNI